MKKKDKKIWKYFTILKFLELLGLLIFIFVPYFLGIGYAHLSEDKDCSYYIFGGRDFNPFCHWFDAWLSGFAILFLFVLLCLVINLIINKNLGWAEEWADRK